MNEDDKNCRLAIYLLKENVSDFKDAIKSQSNYDEYNFNDKITVGGGVIVGKTKKREPSWRDLIQEGVIETIPVLRNTSNRAVVFFIVQRRIFAIPFGYGKHLLKEDCIDHDFGLKTALNVVNADKLLSIDKANIGDLAVLTKTQASRKGSPDYFNVDILKDLLRSITGEPNVVLSSEFGGVITGNEGVYISPKTSFIKIPSILGKLNAEYKKKTYKARFDWIDNVKTERDPVIIEKLRGQLIDEMKAGNSKEVYLAPPFIMEFENFGGIAYTPKGELYNEFDIENYYKLKEDSIDDLDWERLTRKKIFIKSSTDDELNPYSLWRFLNFETTINNHQYIFTLSNWYRIDRNYYKAIYRYCSQIKESDSSFPDCKKGENEGQYNERLANSNKQFVCLDKKLIRSDISRSEIEACDVFTKSKELIHVKFRESSSTLSHLFAQGKVSASSLRRDRAFRYNLRAKLESLGASKSLIALEDKNLKPGDYTITFAIIESKKRSFVDALPFFSLINFRNHADEIITMGFNLRVKKILIQ